MWADNYCATRRGLRLAARRRISALRSSGVMDARAVRPPAAVICRRSSSGTVAGRASAEVVEEPLLREPCGFERVDPRLVERLDRLSRLWATSQAGVRSTCVSRPTIFSAHAARNPE
jgi:hypothetical protein